MKKYFLIFVVMLMILGLTYTLGEKIILTLVGGDMYVPIMRVNTEENKLAFTFNVTHEGDISELLKLLKQYNIKSTIFVTENMILDDTLVEKILLEGHQIGLLAFTDKNIETLTINQIVEELKDITETFQRIGGEELEILRTFEYNSTVSAACKSLGIKYVLWDVDSNDVKEIGVNDIVQRINYNVKGGSIVVFNTSCKYTFSAIRILLESQLIDEYQIVSLKELLYHDNYYINAFGEQIRKR
ncbi:polysaccharide deacetylase family protein [Anaerobranca gottschalkii]|uniref:Peptidoglycan/xylan/chitin deacetylase, PgdA/CDA1 family n=1 Tax=Anaerobranca gottschalkii DSM 13577 TaxID=1120990 RepID=A0A1H9Y942_9FIRM|nr:polysaccharide deacetylase family protein [Anaerobranca gottschalkii]SES65340.1 Peptidoglycan/xylan/chitin deacetylase, PgdA/CDA1 family [Anaerobranca gottschalkii DSM 13577]